MKKTSLVALFVEVSENNWHEIVTDAVSQSGHICFARWDDKLQICSAIVMPYSNKLNIQTYERLIEYKKPSIIHTRKIVIFSERFRICMEEVDSLKEWLNG